MAKWILDPTHSEIEFKVRHMMITTVKGHFENFQVSVELGDKIEEAKVRVEIQADSINTKNNDRDKHLQSADFFDIEKYPIIVFESTKIEKKSDTEFKVTGDLTIKDVSKEISLDLDFPGIMKDPWGNQKAGITVNGKINRTDFGLNWNTTLEAGGVLVSEEVKFSSDMEFVVS